MKKRLDPIIHFSDKKIVSTLPIYQNYSKKLNKERKSGITC